MHAATETLSPEMLELVAQRFRLLGEPLRIRILEQLREGGEIAAGEVATRIGASQQNVSRHLTAMHAADLLRRRREGNRALYSIADPATLELCELVCDSIERSHEDRGRRLRSEAGAGAGAAA